MLNTAEHTSFLQVETSALGVPLADMHNPGGEI